MAPITVWKGWQKSSSTRVVEVQRCYAGRMGGLKFRRNEITHVESSEERDEKAQDEVLGFELKAPTALKGAGRKFILTHVAPSA